MAFTEIVEDLHTIRSSDKLKKLVKTAIETQERAEKIREADPSFGSTNPGIPLILGKPGIGKTAMIKSIAEEMNLALVEIDGALDFEELFKGHPIPVTQNGSVDVKWTRSEILKRVQKASKEVKEGKKRGILLFLDDVHFAADVAAPILQELLTEKSVNGIPFPKETYFVLAGNFGDANHAREFPNALLSRVLLVKYEPDGKEIFKSLSEEARTSLKDLMSITGLEFFRDHYDVFEDKEEGEDTQLVGTVRNVKYLLMLLKNVENKFQNGELEPAEFYDLVASATNYLPDRYREGFLRYYFSVRDIDLVSFIESKGEISPQKVVRSIAQQLQDRGLDPENEPVDVYVRGTLAGYFSEMMDDYVEKVRTAAQKKNPDRIVETMIKFRKKLSRIAALYNALATCKISDKKESLLKDKIVAGFRSALQTTVFAEIKTKITLARNIYAHASDDHQDVLLIDRVWKLVESSKSKLKGMEETIKRLEEIKEEGKKAGEYVHILVNPSALYLPFASFFYDEKIYDNGKEVTISEMTYSDLNQTFNTAHISQIISSATRFKEPEELSDEEKKLRKKYNSMRL